MDALNRRFYACFTICDTLYSKSPFWAIVKAYSIGLEDADREPFDSARTAWAKLPALFWKHPRLSLNCSQHVAG